MFEVLCADGRRRHADPFPTRHEASTWAEWGHCCLAVHTIRPLTDGPR